MQLRHETRASQDASARPPLSDAESARSILELRRSSSARALTAMRSPGPSTVAPPGVLNKAVHLDEVVGAVRRLRAGETLLPLAEVVDLIRYAGSQRQQEYEARKTIARLTGREVEVLRGLAEGLDSQGVADRLHITVRTERNHVASILSKLGVHSRLQAVVFAARHGLVEIM
jgi:DNA-binding NarL/FixJ family response regulator